VIRALIIATCIVAATATAQASTRRIAVIVGNNAGNSSTAPLHFAEADAAKLAQVLGELGGVAPADLFMLRGQSLAALTVTFERVKRLIASVRIHPANRVVVLFYFSGHSDGESLELGRDRLTFSELRRWLAALGADVRVVLIDSCKSGALLAAKGGTPAPGFQIRMTDELASSGEALLTSSAADEASLESREIAGSFFTHHLISGLRGAADTSGDGLVTLAEAYQYAYAHTLRTTGETVVGMQHPAYDYRLSGQGELVLSELAKRTATLQLPGGFDRIVVIELARAQVTAEVTSDTHVRLAVQPGRYAIRARRAGKLFAARVTVAIGRERVVRDEELSAAAVASTTSKGEISDASAWQLMIAGGASAGVARSLGEVVGARVELVAPAGWALSLDAGSRTGTGFRETSARVMAGYRIGLADGAWSAWAGLEIGGGVVVQSRVDPIAYSGVLATGGIAGGAVRLTSRLSAVIEAALSAEVLKRDGATVAIAVPAGWLGILVRL